MQPENRNADSVGEWLLERLRKLLQSLRKYELELKSQGCFNPGSYAPENRNADSVGEWLFQRTAQTPSEFAQVRIWN